MNKIPPFTLLLCALLLAAVPAGAVGAAPAAEVAATFRVTKTADTNDGICDSDCSLREAVIASSIVPGSTVVIPAGDYSLTRVPEKDPPNPLTEVSIDGYDLDIDWKVTISGAGAGATRIHGGGEDRAFQVLASGVVTIQNLTITGGEVAAGADYGGGAINNLGTLTLVNCVIDNNTSQKSGGGIDNTGTLVITNSRITNNVTANAGGGIYSSPSSTSTVPNILTIQNSIIEGNSAGFAGGGVNLLNADQKIRSQMTNVLIRSNTAGTGGGIYNNLKTRLLVERSAIIGNSANTTVGGGIDNEGDTTIINTTISGNLVTMDRQTGGGIYNKGILKLSSVTLANNTAPTGAAIYNKAKVDLVNTILSSGDPAKSCELPAPLSSQGRNLDNGNTCGLNTGIGDQVNADPKLGPLAMNDGFTPTHALLAGSPAIDKGTCVDGETIISTDQRGVIRPGNGTATRACDIGAFEIGSNLMVFIPVVVR